ncbi:hypothetical protein [Streptomyces alfalfae]
MKRYTASTITDDALDALYENANEGWRRGDRWKKRARAAEEEYQHLLAELGGRDEEARELVAPGALTPHQARERAEARAESAEAAIERVRRMVNLLATTQTPVLDPDSVRSLLLRAIDDPKESITP